MTVSIASGRVLIVGATGFIGRFVAEASLDAGRPTYVLLRPTSSKSKVAKALQDRGATLVHGLANDKEAMEKLLKEQQIEIVISAVGGGQILEQLSLIEAIKAAGTVKRFLPSEFGHDVDRADPVEPGLSMYKEKREVRRLIEKLAIPFTYICCNSIASWPYCDNTHPSHLPPPLDHFQIYGHGTVKAYFVAGSDIGKFTMKTVDDIRALNKSVHFRPPSNCLNMNQLASLWETKTGRTLPRVTVTENHLLSLAAENRIPQSIVASFTHDIFIKGCQVNFSIDGQNEVEVSCLYPNDPFRTLDDCFNDFLLMMNKDDDQTIKLKQISNDHEIPTPNKPVVEAMA
ncbi:NmrA-like protein [Corchorus capsularis]|uniref:NmrA-like protein n=1 Tax=Corchorus capsularis TaxID=210143 RepID=A0A1R3J5Q5_COCAP|nr:NmrA-like protein [Corchorus capsularis]